MADFNIIPRGQIFYEENGSPDSTAGYEAKIRSWRESAREEARRLHQMNVEVARVPNYIRYIQGDFWDPRRPKYKSRFVDNRIAKSRYDDLALLTDVRPIIDVTTATAAYEETAEMLSKTIHAEWIRGDLDLSLVTAADICKAYGTAFWKLGATKPGKMIVTPCGPDQVMPIQPGFSIQESTAVMYRTWKSINYLKRKFPFCSAEIEREALASPTFSLTAQQSTYARPNHIDQYVWNGLAPGMQRLLSKQAGPSYDETRQSFFHSMEVEEFYVDDQSVNESKKRVLMRDPYLRLDAHNWWYWVEPGQPLYPRKRLIVFAGNRCLYDGPSPFWHGLYPFATLRLNPVFFSFWGLSKYRDLFPLNQSMNEIIAGVLDMIKRTLNPVAITKEGGIPPAAWKEFFPDTTFGAKLRAGMNSNLNDALKYMDPPNIPAWVMGAFQTLSQEYDRMAGNIDVAGMGKKKQIPGGDTWEQMRDSLQTGMRLEGRMIEVFLRDAGTQAVSNILQFYTAKQRLMLLGADGLTREDFNLDLGTALPEAREEQPDFWRNFPLQIVPGSSAGGAKDRTKQVAITLAKMRMISIQELYRVLEYPESKAKRVIAEMAEEAQKLAPPQGKTPRNTRGQQTGKAA